MPRKSGEYLRALLTTAHEDGLGVTPMEVRRAVEQDHALSDIDFSHHPDPEIAADRANSGIANTTRNCL